MRGPSSTPGFTLIELLVTVALAAIVLTLGVPSMQGMIRDSRLSAQSSRLMTALNLARAEAVKRGMQVTLCKADVSASPPACNTGTCNTTSGANCWEQGWLLFADWNHNGVPNESVDTPFCSGGDCIIQVFEALPKGLTLRTGGSIAAWVGYVSTGDVVGSGGFGNDTFRLCQGTDTTNARSIVIAPSGRARSDKGATSCP